MKKIIFLALTSISLLDAMELDQEATQDIAAHQQMFNEWNSLPDEVKQHILSFVPAPGSCKELARLQLIDKETKLIVTDQQFFNDFADRAFRADSQQAKMLLKKVATHRHIELCKALIKADELLKKYASKLLFKAAGKHTWFTHNNMQHVADLKDITRAKTILATGFDPNTRLHHGDTLLVRAARKGNKEMVEQLLPCTPTTTQKKWGALEEAVIGGHEEVARILLDHYTDIDVSRAYVFAAVRGFNRILQLLFEHNANPNEQDELGFTALMGTVRKANSSKETVQLLLEHGADITLTNYEGKTALDIVRDLQSRFENQNPEIIVLLEKADKESKS